MATPLSLLIFENPKRKKKRTKKKGGTKTMARKRRKRRAAPKTRIVYRYRNRKQRRPAKRKATATAYANPRRRRRPQRRRRLARRNPQTKITTKTALHTLKLIGAGGIGVSAGWFLANYATEKIVPLAEDFDPDDAEQVKSQRLKEDVVRVAAGFACGLASLYVKNQYAKIALLGAGFGAVSRAVQPKIVAYLEDPENKVDEKTVDALTAANALGAPRNRLSTQAQRTLYELQERGGFGGQSYDSMAGASFASLAGASYDSGVTALGEARIQRRTRGSPF